MALPFFYKEDINTTSETAILDEASSKHIVQVLRMQKGEQLLLTNGRGDLFTVEITDDNRKKCMVKIIASQFVNAPAKKVVIAISPLKNASRFEWFLEKATEIGVDEIVPLICERTEKTSFKTERLKNILVSAMLQSKQCWLPILQEPQPFNKWTSQHFMDTTQYIAHCEEDQDKNVLFHHELKSNNQLILIGPEGDFTKEEIATAIAHQFIPVSLGATRLRTETAAVVAAVILCNKRIL